MTNSIDQAFHHVFAVMPPGWTFKGLYLASRDGHKRRIGNWYAQAAGPDPRRPGLRFGLTGEGHAGPHGVYSALIGLADQLEQVGLAFGEEA